MFVFFRMCVVKRHTQYGLLFHNKTIQFDLVENDQRFSKLKIDSMKEKPY